MTGGNTVIRKIGVILLAVVFLGSMAWTPVYDPVHAAVKAANTRPTSEADYAKSMKSKAGTFNASYTSDPEAIAANKLITWKLKVETADGKAVKDAEITVAGDMPEHGHGMPTEPKVKNKGDGTYLVEGIKFSMTGWWTMTFTIKAGDKTDSVTFNLQLK